MFKRLVAYIRSWFRQTAESAMDPEIEIQSGIDEAKRRDQDLRNQAAKVIAHKTQLESQIENAAEAAGEAREMAKQALVKADEAQKGGDEAAVTKWNQAAQSLAMKLQASENNLASLKEQYKIAEGQAEQAKEAVRTNAMSLQELSAKRMEMLGTLEQAKMQESVNAAVEAMSSGVTDEMPSLDQVEQKIEQRKAEAMAKAELREATPEGAEAELRRAVNATEAEVKLDELRAELGLDQG
jgi:phage shock protein A